jgi:hypothetical protein
MAFRPNTMQHDFYDVDLLDEKGNIIGKKPRNRIDKLEDIFHTVHVLLITARGEVVLGIIPLREDLPNVYAEKLGTTVATIRRTGEKPLQAAKRAIARELFIEDMPLTKLGERFFHVPPMKDNLLTTYFGISDAPESYSLLDIDGLIEMTPKDIDTMIRNDKEAFAYSFLQVWKEYRKQLPI